MLVRIICYLVNEIGGLDRGTINMEEIRKCNQLKREKCEEAKTAIKDVLSDGQMEKFDSVFDSVTDKVFKGVMMKEKA